MLLEKKDNPSPTKVPGMIRCMLLLIVLLALSFHVPAQPTVHVTLGEQMRINVGATTTTPIAGGWRVSLPMENDNNGAFGVPTSFTRWWHFELRNLNPAGELLEIRITNAQYNDTIRPVVSVNGSEYERIPTPNPSRSGSGPWTWTFNVEVPPGTTSLKLAKYYPYTLPMFEDFRAWYNQPAFSPFIEEEVIGTSVQGRPIRMITLTDESVPLTGKKRAWVHTAVHPSENTAYFNVEGMLDFLLSNDPYARQIRRDVVLTIVPMANPDGVALGNYRTTSLSVNLENEFYAPYNSEVPESKALRLKIEEFMGTAATPGQNPILLLLNLHSTHGAFYPFHFVHQGTWFQPGDPGATPAVNALELHWVDLVKARSPFVALGSNQNSNFNHPVRPYVESMMHDRYSIQPHWEDVMAITLEGSYQLGPISGVPGTDDDYREVGRALAMAIGDFFEVVAPTATDVWAIY
jgi:hypothetical protein